jgi:serine/threonine protein kinase
VTRARDRIGGYRLHEPLARSGLGVIFRAEDESGASLAVKVLQPPLAATAADVDDLASEVWAIAGLNHPNCLRIFATGVEQGAAWIAMEWLTRGSLADRLAERGRLREAEVLAIGIQAAAALGAAHAAGHAHRDVEPNNLVFADAHTVKVTDFGQAALYQIIGDDLGTMWGRTWYVPPERVRAEPEEAYSDIYSLGAVLLHALTGTPIHNGELHALNTLEMLEGAQLRVEDLAGPLHEKTAEVLNRMLAAEPTQRLQHWDEVYHLLTQAGTLVARREASAPRPPTPKKPIAPASRLTASPTPVGSHRWLILAALLVSLLAGFAAWKFRASVSRTEPASHERIDR